MWSSVKRIDTAANVDGIKLEPLCYSFGELDTESRTNEFLAFGDDASDVFDGVFFKNDELQYAANAQPRYSGGLVQYVVSRLSTRRRTRATNTTNRTVLKLESALRPVVALLEQRYGLVLSPEEGFLPNASLAEKPAKVDFPNSSMTSKADPPVTETVNVELSCSFPFQDQPQIYNRAWFFDRFKRAAAKASPSSLRYWNSTVMVFFIFDLVKTSEKRTKCRGVSLIVARPLDPAIAPTWLRQNRWPYKPDTRVFPQPFGNSAKVSITWYDINGNRAIAVDLYDIDNFDGLTLDSWPHTKIREDKKKKTITVKWNNSRPFDKRGEYTFPARLFNKKRRQSTDALFYDYVSTPPSFGAATS